MENRKKNFLSAAFTLTGTIIGAGILGLPYVFAQSGFFAGLFWLVFLGVVMIFINLWMGEITLRTKSIHQLPGYANKYLGSKGRRLMFLSIMLGIYSALLAYLIGEGQSLSRLFFGGTDYALFFGIGFWFLMTILLHGGIQRLKSIEFWGVFLIIVAIISIFVILLPDVNSANVLSINKSGFFIPFGVVLFSLLGFASIPELRQEVDKDRKILKGSIILGVLIPIVLYILFSFVFVGTLGSNVSEVATLSFDGLFGRILLLLGIFTMLTSFFVLSFSLKDYFIYDLKKKKSILFYVSIVPLILYLLVSLFDLAGFIRVLGIGGAVSGGLAGILILLMNKKAKEKGDLKPEYSVPINWFIILLLSLIFFAGIIFEVFL